MTKYTKFEAIFRNETLVFTDRDPHQRIHCLLLRRRSES